MFSRFPKSTFPTRYGLALGITALAFFLTRRIIPLSQTKTFDLFQGAVVVSACYGGLGPGLLTALCSIFILDYFFIPPLHTLSLGITDLVRLCVFGVVALLTSSLSARLKKAKSELEEAHDKLEIRVAQRTEELSHVNTTLAAEIDHRLAAEREILQISSREQRRLGEDLHDGLCQTLAGVRLLSEEVKEKLAARSLAEAQDLENIERRLGEALTQADMLSRGLYPVDLETNGLMAALEELCVKINKVNNVDCRFFCPALVPIEDSATATHLYRLTQEAVANALKSGKAGRINIRLVPERTRARLSITDNGIGLKASVVRKGMGLKLMAYRARLINGTFQIRSRRQGVTRVLCIFQPNFIVEATSDGREKDAASR